MDVTTREERHSQIMALLRYSDTEGMPLSCSVEGLHSTVETSEIEVQEHSQPFRKGGTVEALPPYTRF